MRICADVMVTVGNQFFEGMTERESKRRIK